MRTKRTTTAWAILAVAAVFTTAGSSYAAILPAAPEQATGRTGLAEGVVVPVQPATQSLDFTEFPTSNVMGSLGAGIQSHGFSTTIGPGLDFASGAVFVATAGIAANVPEPSTLILLLMGLGLAGANAMRKRFRA